MVDIIKIICFTLLLAALDLSICESKLPEEHDGTTTDVNEPIRRQKGFLSDLKRKAGDIYSKAENAIKKTVGLNEANQKNKAQRIAQKYGVTTNIGNENFAQKAVNVAKKAGARVKAGFTGGVAQNPQNGPSLAEQIAQKYGITTRTPDVKTGKH
ncbi:uncharacterized protein [Eurosta solidaginis]|uniref:uncharacterized protein n=1 Tax=Eurosta solidaginis TaxID=178769 RepID=UPI00353091B4